MKLYFKYQEALFDLLARQFELARLDEAREAAMIQVVDVATPPELKSSPRRLFFAAGGASRRSVDLYSLVTDASIGRRPGKFCLVSLLVSAARPLVERQCS